MSERRRKRQQVPKAVQIRLSFEVSWLSQNLKVSHAAETGSKVNSIGVSKELAGLQSLGSPKDWDAAEGKRVGARDRMAFSGRLTSFHISAIIEI